MKRPLMGILVGLVLGELGACLPGPIGLLMPASLFLWSFQNRKLLKEQKPFFLFLFWLAISITLGYLSFSTHKLQLEKTEETVKKLEGEKCVIEGNIVKKKTSSAGYVTFTISNAMLTQEKRKARIPASITITGKVEEGKCEAGDRVKAEGKMKLLEKASNPGGFDEKRYSLANGIYATGFFEKIERVRHPNISFRRWAAQIKDRMEEGYLSQLEAEDSAMLCAMIFGEKSYLTEEQKRLYEENGVAHLLAISGLHVSIVGGLIYRKLRKKGYAYGTSCLAGALILIFYGFMTGFGASASRAIIMYLIFLGGEYLGLSYDMISSLALAGILMLLGQPYRLFDGGFLISFASIFAIGAVVPFVSQQMDLMSEESEKREDSKKENITLWQECLERTHRVLKRGKESVLFSLLIYMVTCPIILSFYYEITPYSIFWNLFLLPCMMPLMVDGILSGVLGLFIGHQRQLGFLSIVILRFYERFLKLVEHLPGSLILPGCPSLWKILLYYGGGILCCFLLWKHHRGWAKLVCFLMLLLLLLPEKKPEMRITMLDVGQGDCMLLESKGKTMLLDGGSSTKKDIYENVIAPALRYYGIASLDAIVVTHMDEDHLSGIRELLQAGYPVKQIFFSDTRDNRQTDETALSLQKYARRQHCRVCFLKKGDQFNLGSLEMTCLHPAAGQSFEEKNDSSLILLAQMDSFRALFTGDLGMEQEKLLVESRNCFPLTILKVAHHGSKYSTGEDFLSYFQPRFALISAGKGNRYGHPHNEVLNRLHEAGSRIYNTISSGALVIEQKREVEIHSWKSRSFLTYPGF